MLGNRPATCRKYYVHPAIIDAYLDGSLFSAFQAVTARPVPDTPHELDVEEAAVLELLREELIDLEVSQGELP
jgi:DNA topoisomerase-1